jgi:hypothetical protein
LSGWFSEADLSRARRDTPGCEEILHFNNAGASLMPEPVLDATGSHLRLEARIGGYEAARRWREAIEHVYDAMAALIGCDRHLQCRGPRCSGRNPEALGGGHQHLRLRAELDPARHGRPEPGHPRPGLRPLLQHR